MSAAFVGTLARPLCARGITTLIDDREGGQVSSAVVSSSKHGLLKVVSYVFPE